MGLFHFKTLFTVGFRFCSSHRTRSNIMKYLNVAEKNDAAKNIAAILSRGASNRREGLSPYNKIYEFSTTVFGEQAAMVMTSVSGHLLNSAFISTFKNWTGCNPSALFDAQVVKTCPENSNKIKKTLEREVRSCEGLIIWTDCDREGENIGFEIIKVCSDIKPNLRIYRAKFSEITATSIFRALNTLGQPDRNVSDAVDVRQELDLRTGAAFTRLQTLRLQKVFPQKLADKMISYGSCQFPTLGFVVERYQAIEDFVEEPFWKIKMNHKVKELVTDFSWKRERLFDKNACEAVLDICKENPEATVESMESKPKSKWRPLPLDTVEMEKNISRKLKINAKDAMKIAEKLYTQGFISYPRTETNIFPKELNLGNLVEMQRQDANWGPFAQKIIMEGGPTPRQGKKSDQAHPPIHPTKYAGHLQGNEQRVYEYIVRHFLACVQKDAQGFETVVTVDIAGEKFVAKGLIVLEKNYLEVYVYEKWNTKEINNYERGDRFMPTVLDIVESRTQPPKLLTEADLIALMEKHGIGTDATHAEHIDTIKSREYVGLYENTYFVPGTLGMGLVEGYNSIGLEISLAKPNLRAEFEQDLKLICEGRKDPEIVRREQIEKYRAVFQTVAERMRLIDESLANRLQDNPQNVNQEELGGGGDNFKPILKCPKCGNDMVLRNRKDGSGKFLTCVGYPGCSNAVWLPKSVESVEVLNDICPNCGPNVQLLKMRFRPNPFPGDPNPNVLCIGGCDENVLLTLDINKTNVRPQGNHTIVRPPPTQNLPVRNHVVHHNNNHQRTAPAQNDVTSSLNQSNISRNSVITSPTNNNSVTTNSTSRAGTLDLLPSSAGLNRQNQNQTEEIVCGCNNEALQLTVKKEGPNKGRKFYKCANSMCDFFLWAADDDRPQISNAAPTDPTQLKCKCNLPVVTRTVAKTGPNTGRQFYVCPKPQGQGCGFFKWCDEASEQDNGSGGGGGGGGGGGISIGRGKASTSRAAPYKSTQPRAKRKCGICGQEGHTRNKCPNS